MDLDSLRAELDTINDQMLELFLRRMQVVENVARYKLDKGLPVLQQGRENQILAEVSMKAPPDMAVYSRELFEALMAISRHMQEDILKGKKERP